MSTPASYFTLGVRQANVVTSGSAPRGWIGGRNNPAGSSTDGLTSIAGVVAPMSIEVRDAATRRVITTTGSTPDGQWEADDLDIARSFEILAVDPDGGYEPIVVTGVTPTTALLNPRQPQYVGIQLGVPFEFDPRTRVFHGAPPMTAVSVGALPTGVSFSSHIYSGTPVDTAGAYPVTVTVTDSDSDVAAFDLVLILAESPVVFTSTAPVSGDVSTAYAGHTFTASGGLAPYTYSVTAGSLPAGLSLNASTGEVTGTCGATPGVVAFTVTVTDDIAQTAEQEVIIYVNSVNARRYWRINITASNSYASINQMEYAYAAGGPNIAVGGTPSSDGHYGSYVAANAFDGNYSTIFATVTSSAGWLMYDFGHPVDVAEVRIMPRLTNYQSPNTWTIESSPDGSTWTVISTVTGQTYAVAGWTVDTFKAYAVP